jgi:DNA polymerase elongation subunit (family B)
MFDIPYLVNRITKVLGEEVVERLSPVNVVYNRNLVSQFGKYNTRWHLKGMSCVDYLDVYKKFSQGLRESYKLDDIAEYELGEKKVDFGNMNLATLADKDWKTFVDYNIQDVNLLVKMEEKLQYLELLRMLAYVGLTPFENAMGTLNVITGAAVIEARKNELVVPTFVDNNRDTSKYEGAYVGEPKRGFQDYIVSFDVNSLYPNIMISLNLSPETKMGKFDVDGDNIVVHKLKGDPSTVSKKTFVKTVKDLDLSISRANILTSQKKPGIFPLIVDNFYKERVVIRREMNKYKRKLSQLEEGDPSIPELKDKINKLHIKQFTIKIFINTVYGYFGNKHAPMGDPDISRSITLTGQAVIKQSNKILCEYIKEKCNLTDDQLRADSPVVYNDTDSVYITIKHLIKHLDIPFKTKGGKVTKRVHDIVNDIEKHLNDKIMEWGQTVLNSKDCRFVFKRESISDVGLFLQKKRYILHILDDEGISVNKFKYTGVEVVRTTMPKAIKPYVKKIITTMLLTKDFTETNKVLNEAYDIFKSLSLEDIAFVMGISKYKTESRDEYGNVKDRCNGFKTYKGMPIHVKSAYHYNLLLDKYGLENKYEQISSGDKVRYFYVKQPNKFGIKSIAYKYYYPKEFEDVLVPDTELMFNKIIYSVIERLYESVNWKPRKPGEMVQTDLFELLSNKS